MYGGTVILLTAVLGTAGLAFGRRGGVRGQESSVSENGTAVIAEHLAETVTAYEKTVVEGIDITGKSRGEAETLLKEKMKGLSVVWQDETVSVEEVTGDAVAGLLENLWGRSDEIRYIYPGCGFTEGVLHCSCEKTCREMEPRGG